jgi:hypothetical protein
MTVSFIVYRDVLVSDPAWNGRWTCRAARIVEAQAFPTRNVAL